MRNVEIKARVENLDELLQLVLELTKEPGTLLKQEDTFYKTPNGRLKLRRLNDENAGQLIAYSRDNRSGLKLSDFSIAHVENAVALHVRLKLGELRQ